MTADKRAEAAEVGDLAALLGEPGDYGTVYVIHAQIRELLAERILTSDWFARRLAEARAEAWDAGRAAGHRELRPVNVFGDTESATNSYRARAAAEQAQP